MESGVDTLYTSVGVVRVCRDTNEKRCRVFSVTYNDDDFTLGIYVILINPESPVHHRKFVVFVVTVPMVLPLVSSLVLSD